MFTRKTLKHAGALIAFAFVLGFAMHTGVTMAEKLFPGPPIEVIQKHVYERPEWMPMNRDDQARKG